MRKQIIFERRVNMHYFGLNDLMEEIFIDSKATQHLCTQVFALRFSIEVLSEEKCVPVISKELLLAINS